MCNYKLTVTIGKNSEIVDGGGWVTSMTWRKSTLLEAKDRAQVLALRDLLNAMLAVGARLRAQHLRQPDHAPCRRGLARSGRARHRHANHHHQPRHQLKETTMANGQQDPRDLDEVWNNFMEARTKLLQSMLDFVHAAQKAFDGHIWIAFGYPEGMKGWAAYCRNNFSQQASIMRQLPKSDRRQLLLEAKSAGSSDRTVDQIFDVSASTVRRATADDGKQTGEDQ